MCVLSTHFVYVRLLLFFASPKTMLTPSRLAAQLEVLFFLSTSLHISLHSSQNRQPKTRNSMILAQKKNSQLSARKTKSTPTPSIASSSVSSMSKKFFFALLHSFLSTFVHSHCSAFRNDDRDSAATSSKRFVIYTQHISSNISNISSLTTHTPIEYRPYPYTR